MKIHPSRKLLAMTEQARAKTQISDPTGKAVAANVRRLRELRGLSTYDLSRRLKDAARPIAASAIAKVERAERRVDVGDLVAFAVALDVNPAMLLLPPTIEGDIELTGGGQVPAIKAWDWFRKDMPLRIPEGDDGSVIVEFRLNLPRGLRKFQITNPAGRRAAHEAETGGEPDGEGMD
ncbi:helix-turn-helix domain-containing protein [Streptomyces sp. NPDC055140]